MDHHVPRSIAVGLRLRGVDVITAYEDGTSEADDPALLDRDGECPSKPELFLLIRFLVDSIPEQMNTDSLKKKIHVHDQKSDFSKKSDFFFRGNIWNLRQTL